MLFKYNFSDNQLLGSRPAGVHPPDPFELVAGLDLFGHAFGLGELEGNEINLLICLAVDIDEMLHQSVLHQHQREGIGLMLPKILLPHPSEAANIIGQLGREFEIGVVIVAVFSVSDVHDCILLMNSLMGSCVASSRLTKNPATKGTAISKPPIVNS